jgi:coproporphyrinogen III oxidase
VTRIPASSPRAALATALVDRLQRRFVEKLEATSRVHGAAVAFTPIEWLRDEGRHGGGVRYACVETPVFNRASVNVSTVHYDDDPSKRLRSATAISTIIHPRHPRAPSMHMHISYTETRDGKGYWRMMADLNPSHDDEKDKARFASALERASGALYARARDDGDRYFYIPALARHRGITHFYLEEFTVGDFDADLALAEKMGTTTIDAYVGILDDALAGPASQPPSDDEQARQLTYHTAYLFQVLTLDRGTTSGLLVHDQNDVGIMGSLPAFIDRALLSSWATKVPPPQDTLVHAIVDALPDENPTHVTEPIRKTLAEVVRAHYRAHPEALDLQAAGTIVPPTVDNHGAR